MKLEALVGCLNRKDFLKIRAVGDAGFPPLLSKKAD